MKLDTASMLTIIGGVFYVIGGFVEGLAVGSLNGLLSSSDGLFSGLPGSAGGLASGSGLDALAFGIAVIGIITGLVIVFGGVLFASPDPGKRKLGGILAIVMMLIGGLFTLGGLVIGFILTAIGAYMGLTSKGGRMMVGVGPLGGITVGQQPGSTSGSGPTNYCTRCGSKIKAGAIFCGACGERVE